MELIPSLPEEIGLECLTRLSYTTHRVASRVCRQWRDLLQSREFYRQRKREGRTRQVACLVYSVRPQQSKQAEPVPPRYQIAVFDPLSSSWEELYTIPKYANGLPLFCQLASVDGSLVVMGGWDPATWDPVSDVFVYQFITNTWRQCKSMPSTRSFFACGAKDGKIYVAGGHDDSKNALRSAWVYNVREDEWSELSEMSEERDECEGVVVGDEFWVVSGYATERQGEFVESVEVYEMGANRWRRVEGKWTANRCPRGCVAVGEGGELLSWGELDGRVGVGTCAVELGELTVVAGSAYQGATQGFYLAGKQKKRTLQEVDMGDGFSGFVQSGCCVEI